MDIPFLRSPYNYDVKAASDAAALPAKDVGDSLTVQSMAEEADINFIMYRFGITGKMPEGVRVPEYGDFTGISDYRSALEAVRDAEENFLKIPAKVRANFDNDPQKFLEFVCDPANIDSLRDMGLAKAKEIVVPPEPMLVRVVPEVVKDGK